MKGLGGTRLRVRIYLGEKDKHGKRPLYREILELLRREGAAGATVQRGISGFGATSRIHGDHLLRLSQDLPVIVEFVDDRETVDRVLPLIAERIDGGLVTCDEVKVLHYAADSRQKEE